MKLPKLPDMSTVVEDGLAERAFWAEHLSELEERYPNHLVALKADGTVVAHEKHLRDLIASLERLGVDFDDVLTRYIDCDDRHVFL